jgi:hypothetical protein
VKITTVEKALEDFGLYRPVNQPGCIEVFAVTS